MFESVGVNLEVSLYIILNNLKHVKDPSLK